MNSSPILIWERTAELRRKTKTKWYTQIQIPAAPMACVVTWPSLDTHSQHPPSPHCQECIVAPTQSSSQGCGDNGQRIWHCFGSCEGLGSSRQMILYLQLCQISYSRKIELFCLAPFHITMFSALRFALVVLQPLPFPFSPLKHRAHFLQNGANSPHKGSCSHQPHPIPRVPFNLSLQCSLHQGFGSFPLCVLLCFWGICPLAMILC